jgi:hypothetical protein
MANTSNNYVPNNTEKTMAILDHLRTGGRYWRDCRQEGRKNKMIYGLTGEEPHDSLRVMSFVMSGGMTGSLPKAMKVDILAYGLDGVNWVYIARELFREVHDE